MSPLDYAEIGDADLRALLERCEQRILGYTQDMKDALFAMAPEVHRAKEAILGNRLVRGQVGYWSRWVARVGISLVTADRLAEIGRLERDELEALRNGIFKDVRGGSFAGIAAFLTAPAEVQEEVEAGRVPPKRDEIQEAVTPPRGR